MDLESKRILAFFLIGLIMIWWMATSSRQRSARKEAPPPAQVSTPQSIQPQQRDLTAVADNTTSTAPSKPEPKLEESLHTLENEQLQIEVSSLGGYIAKIYLKDYRQSLDPTSDLVELRLVHDLPQGGVQWQFRIDQQVFNDRSLTEVERQGDGTLVFTYQPFAKIQLRKRYQLDASGSLLHMEIDLINRGDEPLMAQAVASLGAEVGAEKLGRFNGKEPLEMVAFVNDKRVKSPLHKVKQKRHSGNSIPWAGVMDRYFIAAMVPVIGQAEAVQFDRVDGDVVKLMDASGRVLQQTMLKRYVDETKVGLEQSLHTDTPIVQFTDAHGQQEKLRLARDEVRLAGKGLYLTPELLQKFENHRIDVAHASVGLVYPPRSIAARSQANYAMDLFLGPKDLALLTAYGKQLKHSLDLGDWIGFISRPMLSLMNWMYRFIGNYGVVIILLTILVRLLLYPLTAMQFRSMKRMQALKPHMDELRQKYKDNKEELNKQMLQLFRTHRVNPMGGCFPLLIQMPIFFALYRVLFNAIELRHAPFVFWLKDLSVQDPLYITPVLLGITMFLQQKMTPTAAMEPAQEMMMKLMPIMFAVFMLWLPSGLTLYILVSTVLGVAQQWMVNRQGGQASDQAATA